MTELINALGEIPAASIPDEDLAMDLADLISVNHFQANRSEEEKPLPSNSVLDHFGFSRQPFSDTVDPDFFYQSSVHETALKKMTMTVEEEISLGLVHGKSGTGKTLLTQMLLQGLPPEFYRTVLVLVSPGMSKTALLKEILMELLTECEHLPNKTQDLLNLLHERILHLYGEERKLVILIDEAHFLSSDALHMLRTISNLETPRRKLCVSILFAESSFVRRLAHPSYQSLRNRMYLKAALGGMDLEETVQYITFRLLAAGCHTPLFEEDLYPEIQKHSDGICREINRICHNCLSEAYLRREKRITREIFSHALE